MRRLKVVFLMNPLKDWDTDGDTSLAIMTECARRGHSVYFMESKDLVLLRGRLHARVLDGAPHPTLGFAATRSGLRNLEEIDAVVVRKEPPFNGDYLACTYLLDFLAKKVFIMNSPAGIRSVNEKIGALVIPRLAPDTAVVYGHETARQALEELRMDDAVLKRIDLKGGAGILRTGQKDPALKKKVEELTRDGMPVVVQRFVPHTKTGDKRILLLDGEPLGAFTRIPGPKDFRANMMMGGRAERAAINAADRRIIRALKPLLKENGLYLTGIDVLDGYLSEVNVTSPAGIPEINGFEGTRLEGEVVDFIQKMA